jgi:LmbE family N-acetylglucosaminyl deacetylase
MSQTIFNKTDRVYILSPHIDDAIWSLGSLILELVSRGIEVNVITIFSTSSYANGELLKPTVATKIRKAEDSRALKLAGVNQSIYLDYDEAVVRGVSLNRIVDKLHVPSVEMVNSIREDISRIVQSNLVLLVPGGFGYNIDHLVVRQAAEGVKIDRVYYYEELPYAARDVRVASALNFLRSIGYTRIKSPVDQNLINEHTKLYNVYKSQIKPTHIEQIEKYLLKDGFGIWIRNEK